MEFHELGDQCSETDCKQLDFLPFNCSHCNRIYCKEHYLPDKHICLATFQGPDEVTTQDAESYYVCSYEACEISSAVVLNCIVCHKHYCISHRHHGCLDKPPSEEDIKRWNQPREQFKVAKNEVDRQVSTKLHEQINKKGNSTARKVQIMKLKGRARGTKDIPLPHRLYFLCLYPLQYTSHAAAVYINKEWTLGRVIDCVAELCKIPNRNNEANAPKLRIFQHSNGVMLSPLSKHCQSFIDEGLVNDGDKLILEYVPSSNVENYNLINLSSYKE